MMVVLMVMVPKYDAESDDDHDDGDYCWPVPVSHYAAGRHHSNDCQPQLQIISIIIISSIIRITMIMQKGTIKPLQPTGLTLKHKLLSDSLKRFPKTMMMMMVMMAILLIIFVMTLLVVVVFLVN